MIRVVRRGPQVSAIHHTTIVLSFLTDPLGINISCVQNTRILNAVIAGGEQTAVLSVLEVTLTDIDK